MERVASWPTAASVLTQPIGRLEGMVVNHLQRRNGATAVTGRAFVIGPLGSRKDYLTAYRIGNEVYVRAGCYLGTLSEFAQEIEQRYSPESTHGRLYRSAIAILHDWARVEEPVYNDVWAGWH